MAPKTTIGDDDDTPTLAVVNTVSNIEGVPPEELMPPLGDEIDIQLLESFIAEGSNGTIRGQLEFTYREHDVTVTPDGTVTVYPADA